LLWFESDPPDSGRWPHQALAAVTTHDLPTVAGLWSGHDLQAQKCLGLHPNEESTAQITDKLSRWTGVEPGADVEAVIGRTYALLGQAPTAVITATLDDALAVEERPNQPGTVGEWPNWSLALPKPLEEIEAAPLAEVIGAALDRRRRPAVGSDGPAGP
jgi:4-alpha-glucanotransferase